MIGGAEGAGRIRELTYQDRWLAISIAVANVRVNGFRTLGDVEEGFKVPAPEDCADRNHAHFNSVCS